MSKAKSLSERLAEIANPAPALIDPEDEYNEETKARLDRYDEEYEASVKPIKKTLKAKTSLRQSNAILLSASDKRYAGTRISRKDLEDDSFEDSEPVSADGEGEEESKDDEIEEFKKKFAKLGASKMSSKNSISDSDEEFDGDEDAGTNVDEGDEEGDDEELDEENDHDEGDDEELDEENDYDEEESENEEDDGGLISNLLDGDDNEDAELDDRQDTEQVKQENKKRVDSDVKKGNSIKHQLSLWDQLLECRIKYHKTINLSNRMPRGPTGFKSFLQVPGEKDFATAAQSTQNAIKTFLDTCLELQDALLKSNPVTKGLVAGTSKEGNADDDDEEIPSDSEEEENKLEEQEQQPRRKKLKLDEYEQEIDKRFRDYRDFCNRTLHLWYEKTKGRTAGSQKSGFGAFDTSIIKQIEGILSDKQRLLNRTRIKRSAYRVLGVPEKKKVIGEQPAVVDDTSPDDKNQKADDDLDAEIYDDDDFYHQLLRELIEKRTSEGGSSQISVGKQWLEIQKLRAKAKRKVDAKASKGRRLRYQVHPKLVSFMAPFPETSWNDVAKNELFSSLFRS